MSWERVRERLAQREQTRQKRLSWLVLILWLGGWALLVLTEWQKPQPEPLFTEAEAWETLASFWPIDL